MLYLEERFQIKPAYLNYYLIGNIKQVRSLPSANRTISSPYKMKLPALRWKSERRLSSSLMKRIIMNYNMEGLSKDEGRMYISEKIKGAGGNPDIFE